MLELFLTWWAQQMRDLLPRRWRGGRKPMDALIVAPRLPLDGPPLLDATPPVVELIRRRRGEHDLGLFVLDGAGATSLRGAIARQKRLPVILRLAPATLLERAVVLPLLAEREPERVLEYEMDRFTPFRAGELFWSWAVERRDRARGQLHMRLSFVPKILIQPLLEAMRQAGVTPVRLEAPSPSGEPRSIELERARTSGDRWRRRGLVAAGGVCAALAVAVLVLPFMLQQGASANVEKRIAALQPQVTQAERLRREIAARVAGTDVFAAEQARVGDTLEVLAALTAILPDDTFLTELALRQGKLSLSGQSAAAARLISALSADPVIRNPAFAAPVTRVENGRADQFSIRAEIAP